MSATLRWGKYSEMHLLDQNPGGNVYANESGGLSLASPCVLQDMFVPNHPATLSLRVSGPD